MLNTEKRRLRRRKEKKGRRRRVVQVGKSVSEKMQMKKFSGRLFVPLGARPSHMEEGVRVWLL